MIGNVRLTLFVLFTLAKHGSGQEAVVGISDNMKKFAEIYGFATQIMNLGGSFMGGANGQSSLSGANNYYSGNALNSKPSKFDSFGSYKPMSSFFENKLYGPSPSSGDEYANLGSATLSEYGGGPLGAASSRSQPTSILQNLMGTFLGSSVDSGGASPALSNLQGFGDGLGKSQTRTGSDIEAIVRSLTRSGAKRAEVAEPDHLNLLSQFFGKRKR